MQQKGKLTLPPGVWLELRAWGRSLKVKLIDGEPYWCGNLVPASERIFVMHRPDTLRAADEVAATLRASGWPHTKTMLETTRHAKG